MECLHYLAHNSSQSSTSSGNGAGGAGGGNGGTGGAGGGTSEGVVIVEEEVLWKQLQKGLTAQQWITKFKTGELQM